MTSPLVGVAMRNQSLNHGRRSFSSDVLIALAEIGSALAASGSLRARLRAALRILERIGAGRSVFYSASAETRSLTVDASHGLEPSEFRPRYSAGAAGRVASSAKPVIVPVLCHDPMAMSEISDVSRWLDTGWNLVAVPVTALGRCIGVLGAYFRQRDPHGFGERHIALEVVASLIGNAVCDQEQAPEVEGKTYNSHVLDWSQAPFDQSDLVGGSPAMRKVYEKVRQVARTNATTLLRGESGTGKELVARAIHRNSSRASQPFIKVNCAALPESLFESELFGHERGAFTGAHARKKGRFELAHGGTLFLDEIGELPLSMQAKLLRALQFREFGRLGGAQTLHSDARIVAATNADIETKIAKGTFREDLFYRLDVFTINLPALRERSSDIPALVEFFIRKFAAEHQRKVSGISSAALERLRSQPFPGNVRELENVIERAVVVSQGSLIQESDFPHAPRVAAAVEPSLPLHVAVERLERQLIERALEANDGSVVGAAQALKTTVRVVRYKIRKLGIGRDRFRS
ncbi:MAG TPA: sigma-54-dependent Fis family transcriptional regulator [Polyangiaceae bacterium]|nr:sigma-54-dependent Fis family transcriptional regulator [Polyangiaceae bacterium]